MLEHLLDYYERELFFLRRMGSVFSRKYPKIAQRLMLEPDKCDDPHVERILEGAAFLAARVHAKLDEEFPEICGSFLDSLLPHYLLPIPSLSIAQLHPKPGQWLRMPPGTLIHTRLIRPFDTRCRFRTCLPVNTWPIVVHGVQFSSPGALQLPADVDSSWASWGMRLLLRSQEGTFKDLKPPQERSPIRFYLDGPRQFALYEALVRPALSQRRSHVYLRLPNGTLRPLRLRPVGFAEDEGVLPYSGRSFLGYRLLQEYFAFPKKFLFLDLDGLDAALRQQLGTIAEIIILGSGAMPSFTPQIDDFRLGCTPIINLFPQPAEPISLNHTRAEYRVVGDARHEETTEVYSVDDVVATSLANPETVHYQPLYGLKDGGQGLSPGQRGAYYKCSRRSGEHGSEVFISLVDLGLNLHQPARDTLLISTTCTNRELAGRLPLGISRRPRIAPSAAQTGERGHPSSSVPRDEYDLEPDGDFLPPASWADKLAQIDCLERPTPARQMPTGKGLLWRLVGHLNLNHLSLVEDPHGLAAFRELLRLYDAQSSGENNSQQIAGILHLSSERTVARARDGLPGFCRGVALRLRLHSEHFVGASPFLFAAVLETFFSQYVSINSFTSLYAENEYGQEIGRWAPRLGVRPVL